MAKSIFPRAITLLFFLGILQSCIKDNFNQVEIESAEENIPVAEQDIFELEVPEGFAFQTSEKVRIRITDNTPNVRYDVYAYSEEAEIGDETAFINDEGIEDSTIDYSSDVLNHILFSGVPYQGTLEHSLVVPVYFDKLYLRRKEGGRYSSTIIDITDNSATYTHTVNSKSQKHSKSNIVEDFLFCVNGSGELFQIDPLNGDLTQLSDMPNGSFTCAIDQANHYLYSIGRSRPNPLNRYDIVNDTWTTIGNINIGGPRLDYNSADGLLYFSTRDKLYTIDPVNATILSTWDIEGLHKTGGGDLAFAEDGTLFLCSFSGLYRLELDSNNVYQSTRISAEDLPFNPTSMTFDSNNELWLANNGSSSNLINMDTQTGGWAYAYGPGSNSDINFNRTINDLTTYRIINEDVIDPDTDGDGITDSNDDFPNDVEKAFEQFTPSRYGLGTVTFEDLWPFLGDYDFNDTTVNYRFVAIINAENRVVQLDVHFEVTSDGAGFTNAFGFEMENISPDQIASVTGTVLTEGYINNAPNGVEEEQDNAVIILFDNNETMLHLPTTVQIKFNAPITTEQLGLAPFNPFLIVNRDRSREIHLPNMKRTGLGTNFTVTEGVNRDMDGNYQTNKGLPWAIDIIHNFRPPRERVPVNQAYNFFNEWVISGGRTRMDWYKDSTGYRNETDLKQD